jgi:hypothetical protein
MLDKIASALGRNDEIPNIELANLLVETENELDVAEIASGLKMKSDIANDCIKVLYEIGERNPKLIAPYTDSFIDLLKSKNNRLVWGAMTALARVTALEPNKVYSRFDEVYDAYKSGSVITIDNSISVIAELCVIKDYQQKILPLLIEHLQYCRLKEIPQHLTRMSVCINEDNVGLFKKTVEVRFADLTKAQQARVNKVIKIG